MAILIAEYLSAAGHYVTEHLSYLSKSIMFFWITYYKLQSAKATTDAAELLREESDSCHWKPPKIWCSIALLVAE